MNVISARFSDSSGQVVAAIIDDEEWGGITQTSRLWPAIEEWVKAGGAISPHSVPLPAVADYQVAIQTLVDETAASKQFNDGVTLASYVNSTVPAWAAQSSAFVAWRDQVWTYAYSELAKVQAGQRIQPTVADFLTELPVITWPAAL